MINRIDRFDFSEFRHPLSRNKERAPNSKILQDALAKTDLLEGLAEAMRQGELPEEFVLDNTAYVIRKVNSVK